MKKELKNKLLGKIRIDNSKMQSYNISKGGGQHKAATLFICPPTLKISK